MTLNTAYFELAEAIWNNDHEEMMVDHENTLQRLASMKLRMDGLKAVCLRLLNQRTTIPREARVSTPWPKNLIPKKPVTARAIPAGITGRPVVMSTDDNRPE